MQQLFSVLLLTSLITPSAFAQKQQLDREVKNLKGTVKSVESASSPIDKASGRPGSRRVRTGREEFDPSGNLTVEMQYDQFGEVLAVVTHSLLDGERVVKEELKGNSRENEHREQTPSITNNRRCLYGIVQLLRGLWIPHDYGAAFR